MSQTFPPVRLAALDLDGTLLSDHSAGHARVPGSRWPVPPPTGVVIVPATGRPLGSLPPIVANCPVCAMRSPPTVPLCGICTATRWVPSTAGTPTPPSIRPVNPTVCCTPDAGGDCPGCFDLFRTTLATWASSANGYSVKTTGQCGLCRCLRHACRLHRGPPA